MPVEHKLHRVEEDGCANRCQGIGGAGQCPYEKAPNSEFCHRHVGINGAGSHIKQEEMRRNYRLTKWQARINEFADNDKVKSLREEIGILRICLEEILNQCHDSHDILLYSNRISDIVMKINKVVGSCHKLEQAAGVLLDKEQILRIAQGMIEVISRHVQNQDVLDVVAEEIITVVTNIKNPLSVVSSNQ